MDDLLSENKEMCSLARDDQAFAMERQDTPAEEKMERTSRPYRTARILAAILLVFIAAHDLYAGDEEQSERRVVFQEGLLSVSTEECPLGILLKDIENEIDVRFLVNESVRGEKVSLAFESQPLLKGLKKILSRTSYLLVFDGASQLSQVIVVQKRGAYLPSSRRARSATRRTYRPRTGNARARSFVGSRSRTVKPRSNSK